MTMAAPGHLNVTESPSRGSRSVDCFEKLEQIGEGTYGLVTSNFSLYSFIANNASTLNLYFLSSTSSPYYNKNFAFRLIELNR
jgi:hypothetical protein